MEPTLQKQQAAQLSLATANFALHILFMPLLDLAAITVTAVTNCDQQCLLRDLFAFSETTVLKRPVPKWTMTLWITQIEIGWDQLRICRKVQNWTEREIMTMMCSTGQQNDRQCRWQFDNSNVQNKIGRFYINFSDQIKTLANFVFFLANEKRFPKNWPYSLLVEVFTLRGSNAMVVD